MEEIDKRIVEVARNAVKEYLESLMNTERDVFIEGHGGLRNGFYERKVKTKFECNIAQRRDNSIDNAIFCTGVRHNLFNIVRSYKSAKPPMNTTVLNIEWPLPASAVLSDCI